jgi:hypothetical protein
MRRPKRGDTFLEYSEMLRLIGQYIEHANLAEIRLIETEDGMILQGRVMRGERAGQCETYQLAPEDVSALLQDAYSQRSTRI